MKLKKLFALALAVCMMALAVPAAFAAGLTLDYGTTPTTPVVEVPTPVVYNTRTTSRATTALRSDELAAIEAVDADPDKLSIDKEVVEELKVEGSNAPYYKIDLSAKAESNIVVQTQAKAIDVILVLDCSGNMALDNRMGDLIKAINGDGTDQNKGFLANVKATAKDSRVAVVTYADQGESEVISGTKDISNGAFVKLSEEASYETLRKEISSLTAISGADAYSNEGFANAAKLFQSVPGNDGNYDNPRIVVFFTAGIPGVYNAGWEYHTGNGRSAVYPAYNIAQESIHWSRVLKEGKGDRVTLDLSQEFWTWEGWISSYDKGDSRTPEETFLGPQDTDYRIGCGATVYCIGLNLPKCEQNNHDEDGCSGTRVNEYLYRISSHRPDGSHVGSRNKYNPWEEETRYDWGSTYKDYYTRNISSTFGKKYPEKAAISYYQEGDVSEISKMFELIDVNVEQNQPITNVTVRDYLAPGFVPCDDQGTPLRDGDTFAGGTVVKDGDVYYIKWESVTLEPNETEFTESIYVKPVDDYYGGNGVQTNIYGPSGLYSGDTLFASFPDCRTNVPVKAIDPAVQHQTVYLSNTADLLKLRESSIDSTLNGKNNVGVIVTYELKDGTNTIATYEIAKGATSGVWKRNADGEVITSWPITPTECASYTLTCTVNGGTGNVSDPKSATATVHVLKPTVETKEEIIHLGNNVTMTGNIVDGGWSCADPCSDKKTTPTTTDAPPVSTDLTWSFVKKSDESSSIQGVKLSDCTEVIAIGTLFDQPFKSAPVWVHVLKPEVAAGETTTYIGNQ